MNMVSQEAFNQGCYMLKFSLIKEDKMISPLIEQTSNHSRPIMCQTQEIQMPNETITIPDLHNLNNNIGCDMSCKRIIASSEHTASVHNLTI